MYGRKHFLDELAEEAGDLEAIPGRTRKWIENNPEIILELHNVNSNVLNEDKEKRYVGIADIGQNYSVSRQ